jgi:HAD superfamily hydrolase (TIGR01662 family)
MNPDIKVILFDLGKTLMYSLRPWPEVFDLAYAKLRKVIMDEGAAEKIKYNDGEFRKSINNYYDQRNIDLIELGAHSVLRKFIRSKGFNNISDTILRQALDAMYAITQTNWYLEDNTIEILDELNKKGYQMGLISNAADDRDVQQLIDRMSLRPYFDFILTSAACGHRKPHPLMFQLALNHFSVKPEQTAMVGDTLAADITGAENLGIYSIWITRRVQLPPDGELSIQPQAIISNLTQILPLLEDLRKYPKTVS